MKTKAIIVDDEKMARVLLKGMVNEHLPNVEIVGECSDLPSAVKTIVKEQPELVFLDIEMPGHSGLELLDFFEADKVNFKIIFITAYNQYAIQAFKLSAVDYLLKPVDAKDLIQAFELFEKNRLFSQDLHTLNNNFSKDFASHKLAIHSMSSVRYVDLNDIVYIAADGAYSNVVLMNGQKITASKGLKHFEEALANYQQFMRCHKSNIINLMRVTEFVKTEGGSVMLADKYAISISQDKLGELKQRLAEVMKIS